MSLIQQFAKNVASESWYDALEQQSRQWYMRCPCGQETSVWEMGGIRFRGGGTPVRRGVCGRCHRTFIGQVYWQPVAAAEWPAGKGAPVANSAPSAGETGSAVRLWIDGVGAWVVQLSRRLTIGGPVDPAAGHAGSDLSLLAPLGRQQAVLECTGERWQLLAEDARVGGRPIAGSAFLADGDEITLTGDVRLRFRQPSVLTPTAVLTFASGHRPSLRIDGVVLLDEVCLLGPGADAHIRCCDWTETVILFRRDGGLWVRSRGGLRVNEVSVMEAAPAGHGAVVSGSGFRFRVEGAG